VEDAVKKSSRHFRYIIIEKLYSHLREHYSIGLPDEFPFGHKISLHQLDALLAFKSDARLDELRAALERIDEGTFGFCLRCKNDIADNMIDEDPTRRFCEECEVTHLSLKYEREHAHA
jgi:DnaK suppressor protein